MKNLILILFLTFWMNRLTPGVDISVSVGELGRIICQFKNIEQCPNLLNNSNNTMGKKLVNISLSVEGLDKYKHNTHTTTNSANADLITEDSEINSQIMRQNDNLIEDNFTFSKATENNDYLFTENLTESSLSTHENVSNGNLSFSTSGDTDFPYTLVIAISASVPAAIVIIIGFIWKKTKCQLKLSLRTAEEGKKEDANLPNMPSPLFSINVEPVASDETEKDTSGYLIPTKLIRDKQLVRGTMSNDSVSKHIYEEIDEKDSNKI